MSDDHRAPAEALAQKFHETYERLAPAYAYRTREASAVPWDDVPEPNRSLMVAVCAEILADADAGAEVWAVVFSNYEPAEIDGLWTNEAAAQRRADHLNKQSDSSPWEVVAWTVDTTYEPGQT